MIVCPRCNITIGCRTTVCPLCHAPLDLSDGRAARLRALPVPYPRITGTPRTGHALFEPLYFCISLALILVAFLTEGIVTTTVRFSYFVAAGLVYLYILIRKTFTNTRFFPQKIVVQAVALSVLAVAAAGFLPEHIVFTIVLPLIHLVSLLAVVVFVSVHFRSPRQYLISLFAVALLGFFPLIGVIFFQPPDYTFVPAVVTASFSLTAIVSLFVFGAKKFLRELRRNFHL